MIHKTTRSILSVLLAALLLVTSVPLTPAFADGGAVSPQSESGESEGLKPAADGVYYISSAEELRAFAEKVNDGETTANAILTANIDLNNQPWYPIGTNSNKYTGNFNGDGHTISGLYIDSSANYQGLFGYVSGTVQNLTVSGSVSGNNYVGGVVGYNGSTVENCYNTGTVTGNNFVGGIVGDNSPGASVKNCYNTGSVSGNSVISNVGGVVGYSSGSVTNCYNTGEVSGNNHVGGVVGWNISNGNVTNCYNTGAVSGGEYVGGVVGQNNVSGIVTNCYNTGSVSGPDSGSGSYVGGVVGWNSGPVKNCYNTGKVSGSDSGGNTVGGVVGRNDSGTVTGCYFLQGTAGSGIGVNEGNDSADATPVDDLDALCEKFENDPGWSIHPVLGRPVLNENKEGGDGLPESPYQISTADELKNFRDIVNRETNGQRNAHAILMNDINLNGSETNQWTPIGSSTHYNGTFDGAGHTIRGLSINASDNDDYQGLFGYVSSGGKVQNLTVEGSVTGGHYYVGGIVGYNNGCVENCRFNGTVSDSQQYVGGVVGYNNGCVENCRFNGTVSDSQQYVGGVVGHNEGGSVSGCYNTGEVTGSSNVGGVVGYNIIGASVENCYNTGIVDGPNNGGIVGTNEIGIVKNCYNTGNVIGANVGGIVGDNSSGIVSDCYYQTDKGAAVGIGNTTADTTGNTEAKSGDQFASGEVAWLLQGGQSEPVWGQNNLNATGSLPTLVALDEENALPVYQLTFEYGYDGAPADQISYTNNNVAFPELERTGYTLSGWQDVNGNPVTGETITVTADTTYYAQWTANTIILSVTAPTFDPVTEGYSQPAAKSLTITNSGNTAATISDVTVNNTNFIITDGETTVSANGTNSTYTIQPVAGLAAGSYTATITVTYDNGATATAEVSFTVNEKPTPTPTPDPTPSGPSTGDSTGWADILDELENAENGDKITIDMGEETEVPAEIFATIAGKDVDVIFDLGDVQWSVSGENIPTDTAFTDINLGASLGTSGIPVNVINTITGEVGTVQITLAHDGEFGFTMTLTAPLGKENAGYWANLYHYDEDAEALNFEAVAKIDEDGSVKIPFSHASQYAIVIDTHSHAAVSVSDIFVDVAPNAWYKDAVQYAYDQGLMTGVSATEFDPEATTTRAMIVSILARLENVTSAEAAGFADVNDEWYATAVNWAANVGVVNGYEDNTFQPNTAITREQLAAILMNYAAYKGEDVSARADLSAYTDQPSTWAEEAMQWAVAEKLITGVTADTLQPQGAATRAQVAAILQRFLSE